MPSRVLSRSEMDEFMPLEDIEADSGSVWDAPARDAAGELPETTSVNSNCLQGTGFAIGIEACTALFFYGVWHVWQALR
jgi:hypothetical protein